MRSHLKQNQFQKSQPPKSQLLKSPLNPSQVMVGDEEASIVVAIGMADGMAIGIAPNVRTVISLVAMSATDVVSRELMVVVVVVIVVAVTTGTETETALTAEVNPTRHLICSIVATNV